MDTAWKKRRRVFLLFLLGAILHVTPTISMPARNYTTSPPHKLNIDEYDPREHAVDDPEKVVRMFETATINTTTNRRKLSSSSVCSINNPMDSCWRCGKPHWRRDRRRLASCALGFGTRALGGLHGRFYYVHVSSDDDPSNPLRGTLRHAVIQDEPLWIVFTRDMTITLKQALVIKSHKTIDGRGNLIRIAKGGGLSLHYVRNVIVVGLTITDVVPTSMSDGDGISLCGARDVWIDHNTISRCADGLVDVIMGSTGITISNNHFSHHNEVMLLGHNDDYAQDKFMQVTIAFNRFGEGLIQRMPRCRHGYFHVVNNDYTHWEMYAIGGSAEPTINSQGNRFLAPANPFAKEVTKRVYSDERKWKEWNWRSEGDQFLNGAYFTASGTQGSTSVYARASSTAARPSSMVALLTLKAGNILCGKNHPHCS